MDKYIKFVLKRPILVIIGIVFITVFLFLGLFKLKFDNSIDSMMSKDDHEYILYKKVHRIFGNTSKFIIINVTTKDNNLWTYSVFNTIDNLISDLEEYENFNEELENSRLGKYSNLSLMNNVRYDALLAEFNDDSAFQRLLQRNISKLFGEIDVLEKGDLSKLENKILKSYQLKKKKRIDKILSPFTMQEYSGAGDTLSQIDLINKDDDGVRILPKTHEEFERLKKNLQGTPFMDKLIYSKNKKTGEMEDFGILLRLDTHENHDTIARDIWDITESYNHKNNIQIISHGIPILNKHMNDYMKSDLKNFFPPTILLIILIFFFNFRSIRGVVLPLITLMLADIWILGLMGHLGYKITVMGVSFPSLILAIGSSYSIHILNQYYIDFNLVTEKGKNEGLRLSMSHISITVFLAGVTTFIGFMTLSTNRVSAISEWAVFSAIGVFFCVFITITLIPAVIMLLPHKMPRIILKEDNTVRITLIDKVISIMTRLSVRHHKGFLAIVLVIIVISIMGICKLQVEMAIFSYFKEDDPIRKSAKIIGEKFGGILGMDILIDSGDTDGIINSEFLKKVEDFREWLEAEVDLNVGRTDVFTDIIKKMHMAMNNDDNFYYKIPDSDMDIKDYLELVSGEDEDSDGRIDDFEQYIDPEYKIMHISARLCKKEGGMIGTKKLSYIHKKILKYLKDKFPGYSFDVSGEAAILVSLAAYVVNGQLFSLIFCLIVVGIVIVLLFKNFTAGLISLIPISVAVIMNFGIMGWFGINLDMATAIIASITIGIGVDDTIHFLNTFRHFRAKGFSIDETIEKTIFVSGKAIIYTSLVLIFGFSVCMLSNFKPVVLFGILLAITMIATTIGALVILPSVIKILGVDLDESENEIWIWKYLYIGRYFNIEEEAQSD